jgi:hypothetical protein
MFYLVHTKYTNVVVYRVCIYEKIENYEIYAGRFNHIYIDWPLSKSARLINHSW